MAHDEPIVSSNAFNFFKPLFFPGNNIPGDESKTIK